MSIQSNDIPEGFEMTELGPLPEEWGVTKFDAIVMDISTGDWGETNPGTDLQQCYVLRGTDFYQALKGSFSNTPIRHLKTSSIQKRQLRDGDILIELSGGSKDQPTGRIMIVNQEIKSKSSLPLVFSNFVKRLNIKTDLWPEFFWQYWEHLYQNGVTRIYEKRTTGIRNFKLNDFLASEHIPLPPLPEQKAITRVLSTVQKAIETQDKIIAAARELKKSLMRQLFTYGPVSIAEAEQVPLKETEIGPVPEHWETVRLEQLMRLRTENVLPEDVPDMRYVGLEHMDSGGINLQRWGRTEQVRSAKSRFYPTDILYGKLRPYLDKAALAEWEGVCSTDILVFTAYNETALPDYLAGLLHTRSFIEHAISTTSGVNHPRTSWSSIKSFVTPCPPMSEQQEIARILSTVDGKIESEENRKAALQVLFKTMLHQLMTGKVRVKDLEATAV